MAKDDYFPLLYKLLSYLYKCLKEGRSPDYDLLAPETRNFPIGDEYFSYLLGHALKDGYIEGIALERGVGRRPVPRVTSGLRITPQGIAYLEENSIMRKVAAQLGAGAEMVETVFKLL